MGKFVFVIGGARSGKSSFALKLAASLPAPRRYLATALSRDAEMEERIRRHKDERGDGWETMEEPRDIKGRLEGLEGGVALIDCLTLWLTNLIEAGLTDEGVEAEAKGLLSAVNRSGPDVIAVSNEVGLGIVPANALARRFRDLSGMVNRMAAEAASEVYFLAAGLPMRMK
ncbi:MAG: bifunctional adenosylcobinamide kinase/adenosylcobinamide-phosphate guanylyltransferase [Deltaproteobacteria bacterium]|nr:bifunctional adenosylcobinamide kinase/adenosylcobinamide-phosphate guanylyltransferase [Deltaproteobacteria bacterium]